jgi:hypothetical protein
MISSELDEVGPLGLALGIDDDVVPLSVVDDEGIC